MLVIYFVDDCIQLELPFVDQYYSVTVVVVDAQFAVVHVAAVVIEV